MTAPDAPSLPATLAPDETVAALESGAVVRWWQTTSFLDATGADALTLLDGLCTQAVERIVVGTARLGLFLDAKAKIIAPAILYRTAEETVLLETLPDLVAPLQSHLKKYRLRAKVTLEPVELATIAVVGEQLTMPLPQRDDGSWSRVTGQAHPTIAFVGAPEACAALVADVHVPLADPDAFEADRIERGVAGLHDLLPGRMPAEVGGMASAVALDAGCYLGQEPVARLHYRGHANRSLRRLETDGPISPGTPQDEDSHLDLRRADEPEARPVGRLTTWSTRPDGRTVALAMLRREVASGRELVLAHGATILRPVDDAPA
jgi:folate-binding protein YgfZ